TENDGSYTWTATMWTSDNCLIQVYDTADQTVFDENATFFSITPQHLQGLTHPQAQPSGDAQNAYRLVSVPLELDDTRLSNAFLDDLGQPDDNRWRLFDWQGGQWEEYSGDQTIEPGRSFFLIVKDAGVQLDVGPGHLVMSESYSISLNAGWNSIANPYNFGLTDSELFPDSEEWVTLWAYNGGWDVTSDLVPWEGYGIYVESGGTLHVIPDWFGTGKAKARRKDFRILSEWFVQIEAACGSAVDAANYCGVYDEERGKQAMFRLHKPPAVGEFVHVYLKNADDPTSQFAADFRPAGRERLRWDLAAQTHIPNRPLSFRIKQSKNLPEGYAVILKDKDSGRCETLSPDGIPVFVSGAGPEAMEFELAIGDSKDLSEEETIPAAFQLEPCYPNPFNQTTVIPFSLAEACEVTLIVYNVHGEETCRLIQDKPYGEGLHKAVWSGLDASRQPAASGIYIYKLSTNTGFHAVSRMIFLK
ncbi:T9SS type A sorting domain-containing protein, partial [bacterium]|nr:T9SS type A sorting domain-containing protein [bacterium]